MTAALEWAEWKRALCSGCGEHMDDSMGPDGPEYEGFAMTCFACKGRDELQAKYRESENTDLAGLRFGVRPIVD